MPCDSRPLKSKETLQQRMEADKKRLQKLEQDLMQKKIQVQIGPTGAIGFVGWSASDREGISDVCAYRMLTSQNSFALKTAVQRAEMISGTQ